MAEDNKNKFRDVETLSETIDRVEESPKNAYKDITNTEKNRKEFANDVAKETYGYDLSKKQLKEAREKVSPAIDKHFENTKDAAQVPYEEGVSKRNTNIAIKKGDNLSTPPKSIEKNMWLEGTKWSKANDIMLKAGAHDMPVDPNDPKQVEYWKQESKDPTIWNDDQRDLVVKANAEAFGEQGIENGKQMISSSSDKSRRAITGGLEKVSAKDNAFYAKLNSAPKQDAINQWKRIPKEAKRFVVEKYAGDIGKIIGMDITDDNIDEAIPKIDKYILSGNFDAVDNYDSSKSTESLSIFDNETSQEEKRQFVLDNLDKFSMIFEDKLDSSNDTLDRIIETIEQTPRSQMVKLFKSVGIGPKKEDVSPVEKANKAISFLYKSDLARDFFQKYYNTIREIGAESNEDILRSIKEGNIENLSENSINKLNELLNTFTSKDLKEKQAQEYLSGKASNVEHLVAKYNLPEESDDSPFWQMLDDLVDNELRSSDNLVDAMSQNSEDVIAEKNNYIKNAENAKTENDIEASHSQLENSDSSQRKVGKYSKEDINEIVDNVVNKMAERNGIKEEDIRQLKKYLEDSIKERISAFKNKNRTTQNLINSSSLKYTADEEKLLPIVEQSGANLEDIKRFVRGYNWKQDRIRPVKISSGKEEKIVNDVISNFGLKDTPELRNALTPVINDYIEYANRFGSTFKSPTIGGLESAIKSGLYTEEQVSGSLSKAKELIEGIIKTDLANYFDPDFVEKARKRYIKIIPGKDKKGDIADFSEYKEKVSANEAGIKSTLDRFYGKMSKPFSEAVNANKKLFEKYDNFENENVQRIVNSSIYDLISNYGPGKLYHMDFNDFLLNDNDKQLNYLKGQLMDNFKSEFNRIKEEQLEKDKLKQLKKEKPKQDIRA